MPPAFKTKFKPKFRHFLYTKIQAFKTFKTLFNKNFKLEKTTNRCTVLQVIKSRWLFLPNTKILSQINILEIVLYITHQTFFQQYYCSPPHNQLTTQIRVDNIQHCSRPVYVARRKNFVFHIIHLRHFQSPNMSASLYACPLSKNTCDFLIFDLLTQYCCTYVNVRKSRSNVRMDKTRILVKKQN